MLLTIDPETVNEVRNFYGDNLSDEDVKEVLRDILDRYATAEYFDPEMTFEE